VIDGCFIVRLAVFIPAKILTAGPEILAFIVAGHCYQTVNRRGTESDNLDEGAWYN
jgi:hypothetical protein